MESPRRLRAHLSFVACLALGIAAPALRSQDPAPRPPDTMVLRNGDHVTGVFKSLIGDKVAFHSDILGDLEVPLAKVQDLQTTVPVVLMTGRGERLERQVLGITQGNVRISDPDSTGLAALPLTSVKSMNAPEGAQWRGSMALGAFYSDGNTDRRNASAVVDLERRTLADRLTFGFNWNYSEERNSTGAFAISERRTAAALKYDYFLTDRFYVLGTTTAEGDLKANLDLRYTAGVGFGYQVLDDDDLKLATEAGVSYFFEDYRTMMPTNEYLAARLAYRFEWGITKGLRFLQNLDVFPGLEDKDDLYLKLDSRLKATLLDNMFAQLQHVMDFDNTPSAGADRMDNRFIIAIGWNF